MKFNSHIKHITDAIDESNIMYYIKSNNQRTTH